MSTEFELSFGVCVNGTVVVSVLFGNQSLMKRVEIEHAKDIQRKLTNAIEAAEEHVALMPPGNAADQSPRPDVQFSIGDFVYYQAGEIGKITDVSTFEDGVVNYRIDYCQGKDLSTGPRGGNGPVWVKGYPKPITEPVDVLFVAAMKERYRIDALTKDLEQSKTNFRSLKHSIELLSPKKNDDE